MLSVLIVITYGIGFVFSGEFIGRLSCGITIYLLVGYLEKVSKENIFVKYRYWGSGIFFIGIIFLEIILSYLGNEYSIVFFKLIRKVQDTHSPIMLTASFFIFYLFRMWQKSNDKVTDFISRYIVGAYMLHGGASFLKSYVWDGLFKAGKYYNGSFANYALKYATSICLMVVFGIVCEYLYVNIVERFTEKGYIILLEQLKKRKK